MKPVVLWAMLYPSGRVFVDGDAKKEEDVWRVGLGWPDGAEIAAAKEAGYVVKQVLVSDAEYIQGLHTQLANQEAQFGESNRVIQQLLDTVEALKKKVQANAAEGYTVAPMVPTDGMCRAAREKTGIGSNYAEHSYRTMMEHLVASGTE